MMHWEESGFQFARPIRGLLALLGADVLHWEVAGVQSSNTTYGLRVGKPKPVAVTSPEDYMRRLREAFVIVDPAERRRLIEKQSDKLLKPLGFKLGDNIGRSAGRGRESRRVPVGIPGRPPEDSHRTPRKRCPFCSAAADALIPGVRSGWRCRSTLSERAQWPH